MSTVRRLYFYGVAAASLVMLALGLSGLGRALLDALALALPGQGTSVVRPYGEVSENAALVLVGLPVWLLHWRLAQRAAEREPGEREAALRRLFLYGVLLFTMLRLAFAANDLLVTAGEGLLGLPDARGGTLLRGLLRPLPSIAVAAVLWAYHRRVVTADRELVGEVGASATLRRWYVYGLALAGLLVLLNGAASVFGLTWELAAGWGTGVVVWGDAGPTASAAAATLVGLGLWLSHYSGWAVQAGSAVRADDVRSVLRPVYLFLALGFSIGFALTAAARMLYYALARLLGVSDPGGAAGPLLLVLGGPLGTLVVYGVSWLYHRAALTAQALAQPELPRQTGVRRLYTYLVSLIALAVLATGAGGLLWTVADGATQASRTLLEPDWWREQVSLYATLVVVGLPVWLAHWGPVQGPASRRWTAEEPHSLARRLYLYLTLLAGVLILLGSGAFAARQILDLLLGETSSAGTVTNLARSLAVAAVSGLVVFYHQRVMRGDLEVSSRTSQVSSPTSATGAETSATRPSPLCPYGLVIRREGTEASTWFASPDEARQALDQLGAPGNGLEWATLVRIEEAPPEQAVPQGQSRLET